jgi:hypothetical protein
LAGRRTWPDTDSTFVPGDFSVPHCRNQSAPLATIAGSVASVSVLLITVGCP